MRFTPKTDDELNKERLLPEGEYDAEVTRAKDDKSKTSGADMIKLTLTVYGPDGLGRLIDDYLVSTPNAVFKVNQFAKAAGLKEKYDSGVITADDCVGRGVRVKVGYDEGDGQYQAKNKISAYIDPNKRRTVQQSRPPRPTTEAQAIASTRSDDPDWA